MVNVKKIMIMLTIVVFLLNIINAGKYISPFGLNSQENLHENPPEKDDEPKENYFLVIEYFNETPQGRKLVAKHWQIKEMCNKLNNISNLFDEQKCSFSLNWSKKESCPENTKIFLEFCYKKEIFDKKSWGNLCNYDFECESDFCLKGKCYRGGREAFDDKLEERLKILEKETSEKEEPNDSQITGEVTEPIKKQNWFEKILEAILNFLHKK